MVGAAGHSGGGRVTPVSAEQVFERLREVPEPCSIAMAAPQSIVDMGLVESISVDGPTVRVCLVLTDPSCVHFMSMRRYIRDVLARLDGVRDVVVTMSTTRLWTPDRMNPRTTPTAPADLGIAARPA